MLPVDGSHRTWMRVAKTAGCTGLHQQLASAAFASGALRSVAATIPDVSTVLLMVVSTSCKSKQYFQRSALSGRVKSQLRQLNLGETGKCRQTGGFHNGYYFTSSTIRSWNDRLRCRLVQRTQECQYPLVAAAPAAIPCAVVNAFMTARPTVATARCCSLRRRRYLCGPRFMSTPPHRFGDSAAPLLPSIATVRTASCRPTADVSSLNAIWLRDWPRCAV
jgi:hypothetical protein